MDGLSLSDSSTAPVGGVYKPPVLVQVDERDPTGFSLSGLSFSQGNKNNFGFINRETFAETGWINLNNRFYIPELMRFGQIDPLIEVGQQSFTPYHYSFNNPILFSDPNGLMGEGCCQSVIDFFAGATLTFIDNNSPVPTKLDDSGYRGSAYETGRKVGNYLSIASGAIQTVGGAIGTLGAGGAEVLSLGIATPIALPAGAVAVATTTNGIATISKAVHNLNSEGKSPPNPNGAKGKPDHQEKVKELAEKAKTENPGKRVITEQKIKTEGSNRRPDVQVVDPETGKTTKVYEAERRPSSTRNKKREEEYKRLNIPNETHKVGGQ